MNENNDFYERNKEIIDELKENNKSLKIIDEITLEENRLRRILGPFRNILPKLIISKEDFKNKVDSYVKTHLKLIK